MKNKCLIQALLKIISTHSNNYHDRYGKAHTQKQPYHHKP